MSAYARQMEREFSARSLSTRGNSDMGSQYVVDSGFYMTSFTGTVFIASLVTVGVLLITILVSLTVMLQSCDSKNSGVVESPKLDNYGDCMMHAFHSELNNLEAVSLPSVCWSVAIQYIKEHQYERDLNLTMSIIERDFYGVIPSDDMLDVVLIDIDDIFPSSSCNIEQLIKGVDQYFCNDYFEKAKQLKNMLILRLYLKLKERGWPLILLSRKSERQRNSTIAHLLSAGNKGWSSLIMRLDEEVQIDSREYFSKQRARLLKEGFHISGLISSKMEALTGQYLGNRTFKLPNPIVYYSFEQQRDIL